MVTEFRRELRPFIALPELPSKVPLSVRAVYEGLGLLLECNSAYSGTEEVTPQPYSLHFAHLWCGTSWGSTERGHKQLVTDRLIIAMGEDAGNILYLPRPFENGAGLIAQYLPR